MMLNFASHAGSQGWTLATDIDHGEFAALLTTSIL